MLGRIWPAMVMLSGVVMRAGAGEFWIGKIAFLVNVKTMLPRRKSCEIGDDMNIIASLREVDGAGDIFVRRHRRGRAGRFDLRDGRAGVRFLHLLRRGRGRLRRGLILLLVLVEHLTSRSGEENPANDG